MPAAITFDFDPTVSPFGLSVRLETVALGAVIFFVLVLIALRAGREGKGLEAAAGVRSPDGKLRRDDLILIAFGVVPGAIVGGRLGYCLLHLDYYASNPLAVTDPGQGGLGLSMAVLGGIVTGIAVARLLAAPIGRWLGVAGLPVLLGLGLGKLATMLGGTGQGRYSDASWATSYSGDGPWGSMRPDFPALPAQALEGGLVLAIAAAVMIVPIVLRLRVRPWWRLARLGWSPWHEWPLLTGSAGFTTMIVLWAVARFVAVFAWRDASLVGPFRAEHAILVFMLAAVIVVQTVPRARAAHRDAIARRQSTASVSPSRPL